jgi:hypothetical protein
MIEAEQELCTRQCRHHEAAMEKINGSVSKSSIKWIAVIFALPALVAILVVYAFVQNADYRYGTVLTSATNQANIKLLDERTMGLKSDIVRMQADISLDLSVIKNDLKEIAKELRQRKRE